MKDFIKKQVNKDIKNRLIEQLMDEEYPSTFDMEHFKTLSKFAERVRYCDQHLKKISSGSARIVYLVDDTMVLKLAKNKKGLAQCATEIQWGQDNYFGEILARTIMYHPDDLWVEMELARKVKKSDFSVLEDGINFDEFGKYLKNFELENNGRKPFYNMTDAHKEILNENQFTQTICEFMLNTDSPAGDLMRLNSYGIVNRNGEDIIVIIDFGLTNDIYNEYYK
jgi:hypothetical protein